VPLGFIEQRPGEDGGRGATVAGLLGVAQHEAPDEHRAGVLERVRELEHPPGDGGGVVQHLGRVGPDERRDGDGARHGTEGRRDERRHQVDAAQEGRPRGVAVQDRRADITASTGRHDAHRGPSCGPQSTRSSPARPASQRDSLVILPSYSSPSTDVPNLLTGSGLITLLSWGRLPAEHYPGIAAGKIARTGSGVGAGGTVPSPERAVWLALGRPT
jgi:hypothetical protein